MGKIEIRTVADMRRILAEDGIVVYVERNDRLDAVLRRDPGRLAAMSAMRTVEAVRSKDIVFRTPNGKTHLDIPKTSEFEADGGNRFRIIAKGHDGQRQALEYRVERAGEPGAETPSSLATNHPAMTDDERAAEEALRADAKAEQDRRTAEHAAAYEKMKAMPLPARTDAYEALEQAMVAAIADALANKIFYEDLVAKHMTEAVAAVEYAKPEQRPTVRVDRTTSAVAPYVLQGVAARELAFAPRGAWLVFEEDMGEGRVSRTALMSTGDATPAFAHHPYQGGGYEEIKKRLDGHDAYDLRKKAERAAETAANEAAMARHSFAVGAELGSLEINGTKFAHATVTAVAEREVAVSLRKRGGRNTWSAKLEPAKLATIIERQRQKQAQGVLA